MPIEAAIPILIGADIGTCATALISSIGTRLPLKEPPFPIYYLISLEL
ncbi:MAG: hypothetical protein KJ568_03595 [Actinobacteria bacterium]|nr:hypothetical protein [Actinomycetota bacterium]